MRFRRNRESPAPGLDWNRDGPWQSHFERTERRTLEYDGSTYLCRTRRSAAGPWRLAYGSAASDTRSVAFLFRDGDLQWTRRVDHPVVGLVAGDGTVVILEGGASDDLDGSVRAFDAAGDVLVEKSFRANVADGDLSADGTLAAVQTHPPDGATYLFDLREGALASTHSSEWAQPTTVRFASEEDTWYAYLGTSPDKRPLYALEANGTVAWESKRYRTLQPLSKRLHTRFTS